MLIQTKFLMVKKEEVSYIMKVQKSLEFNLILIQKATVWQGLVLESVLEIKKLSEH